MLLLGLLTILLFVGRQVQPATTAAPPAVAGSMASDARPAAAPRATLDEPARPYASASVSFSPSAAL